MADRLGLMARVGRVGRAHPCSCAPGTSEWTAAQITEAWGVADRLGLMARVGRVGRAHPCPLRSRHQRVDSCADHGGLGRGRQAGPDRPRHGAARVQPVQPQEGAPPPAGPAWCTLGNTLNPIAGPKINLRPLHRDCLLAEECVIASGPKVHVTACWLKCRCDGRLAFTWVAGGGRLPAAVQELRPGPDNVVAAGVWAADGQVQQGPRAAGQPPGAGDVQGAHAEGLGLRVEVRQRASGAGDVCVQVSHCWRLFA